MRNENNESSRLRRRSFRAAAAPAILLAILATPLFAAPNAALPAAVQVGAQKALRVCADPDNLPFSSRTGTDAGLYVELGKALAQALDRSFEPVWSLSYFGKRSVRTTLLSGKCDAYIGLPESRDFMGPRLIFSKPILHVGYAIVTSASLQVEELRDLAGKRIAVQFASTPHVLLAEHEEIRVSTVLDPEAAMQALAAGRVDAAFIWGPTAGYLNKTSYQNVYRIKPIAGKGMQWPVSIGFARSQTELRDRIDEIIERSGLAIAALAFRYGFPATEPVLLSDAAEARLPIQLAAQQTIDREAEPHNENAAAPASQVGVAVASPVPTATDVAKPEVPVTPAHAEDGATQVTLGREIFNGTCSHCHGPDAVQSERRINLRLLSRRYGERMDEVFLQTVMNGRPEKGMPNWTGVFSEEEFGKILAFLHTVQQK
jgi:ABC-type amino acid transport substrate-binding protein/mono/diheme cytochrome c family protein